MDYICQRCRFSFVSGKPKDKCPYCGEKSCLSEVRRAEELVNDLN